MKIKSWIHELDEVVQGQKLGSHAGLIAEEISFLERPLSACSAIRTGERDYHSLHKTNEAPESDGVVLLDCVNWCEQIAHALNVAEVAIEFVVCK